VGTKMIGGGGLKEIMNWHMTQAVFALLEILTMMRGQLYHGCMLIIHTKT